MSTTPDRPIGTADRPSRPGPGERLLDELEALVRRHRALADDSTTELQTELITAEVAMQLALARTALRRYPRST